MTEYNKDRENMRRKIRRLEGEVKELLEACKIALTQSLGEYPHSVLLKAIQKVDPK